ncbi:MAG: hypothetical protein U9O20_01835 [Patescibacteria group bacterium]|nr:hypothetical protein [Patescibacteria group bacterium]
MQKEEKIGAQQIENGYESKKSSVETSPEQILKTLENNGNTEKESLNEITEKIKNSDPSFQQKTAESRILSSLGEKVKKNKLLRAALVGLSLYSANPAFASGAESELSKSETIESARPSHEKNLNMEQFGNLPESRQKDFEQIFASAPEEAKRIMLDELENGKGVDYKNASSNEDPDLLILQQQVVNLQNSGEMDLRRKGGVNLPFDEEHSGKTNGIEYSDNEIAENGGKQEITIENASENQIRSWINYLKSSSEK